MFGHPHTDSFKPLGEQLLEIKEDRHVVIDPPADVLSWILQNASLIAMEP